MYSETAWFEPCPAKFWLESSQAGFTGMVDLMMENRKRGFLMKRAILLIPVFTISSAAILTLPPPKSGAVTSRAAARSSFNLMGAT